MRGSGGQGPAQGQGARGHGARRPPAQPSSPAPQERAEGASGKSACPQLRPSTAVGSARPLAAPHDLPPVRTLLPRPLTWRRVEVLSLEKRALVQVSLRSSKTSALLVDLRVDQGCDPHAP